MSNMHEMSWQKRNQALKETMEKIFSTVDIPEMTTREVTQAIDKFLKLEYKDLSQLPSWLNKYGKYDPLKAFMAPGPLENNPRTKKPMLRKVWAHPDRTKKLIEDAKENRPDAYEAYMAQVTPEKKSPAPAGDTQWFEEPSQDQPGVTLKQALETEYMARQAGIRELREEIAKLKEQIRVLKEAVDK